MTECIPNMAIACPNCNMSLKRVGEKKRLEELKEAKKEFSSEVQCDGKQCTEECESYKKYREDREYPNYIVDLFKEKIKGMDQEKVLKLCEQIHIKNTLLFRN